MSVTLKPMTQEQFERYYEKSIEEYAAEHVKAGNWSEEEALPNARKQFQQLLPDGLETENQVLFTIVNEEDKSIGILWLNITEKQDEKHSFIYDIKLDEEQQGKGYGKASMNVLEDYVKEQGISQIGLHVFAHNKRAVALYEKVGFEMTDHVMKKRIT
ncbi:GNAT family N-acetyltransferase [Pontibacillus marinus]|uniref:N-acetyltransferase domain-containing protein n=1 Tax=Pontibacillus marinus BH030004 = DSM 16465 TaxID=1385511 RepID=A0A0A5G012_9BACI|nr:GNAT family N-acetyltransferase [Pontibacillus marinus]KGX84405.1 hypothetical protein N783_17645 [Pontibacillus marinus BH030004 = DSM 16465]